MLNHVFLLGSNSDTVLLCHLLRGKLRILLDLPHPPAGLCYQIQGTGHVTPGNGDIICKPSLQEAQLSSSVGQGRSFLSSFFSLSWVCGLSRVVTAPFLRLFLGFF